MNIIIDLILLTLLIFCNNKSNVLYQFLYYEKNNNDFFHFLKLRVYYKIIQKFNI